MHVQDPWWRLDIPETTVGIDLADRKSDVCVQSPTGRRSGFRCTRIHRQKVRDSDSETAARTATYAFLRAEPEGSWRQDRVISTHLMRQAAMIEIPHARNPALRAVVHTRSTRSTAAGAHPSSH
jgi:hypothetical protein